MTPTGDNAPEAAPSTTNHYGSRVLLGPTLLTCILLVMCVVPISREPLQFSALGNWSLLAPLLPLPLALAALRIGLARMVIAGAIGAAFACIIVVDGALSLRLTVGLIAALCVALPGLVIFHMRVGGRLAPHGASAAHAAWLLVGMVALGGWIGLAGEGPARAEAGTAIDAYYGRFERQLSCDPLDESPTLVCESMLNQHDSVATAIDNWFMATIGAGTGLAAWAWALTMLALAYWLARRRGTPLEGATTVRGITVAWPFVYVLAASIAAVLVVPPTTLAFALLIAAITVLALCFLLGGIAATSRAMQRWKIPLSIRIFVWVLAIISTFAIAVLCAIGVVASVRGGAPATASNEQSR